MKKTILKQGVLGAAMAVAMIGVSSAAQAGTAYCVVSAWSHNRPTVAKVFKIQESQYVQCGNCEVKWSHYLEANYNDYFEFTTHISDGLSQSEANENFQEYKRNARSMWHQPFYEARGFRCSGRL